MTDNTAPTLEDAIGQRYAGRAPGSGRSPALASWGWVHDEHREWLEALRASDPATYTEAVRGDSWGQGFYMDASRAHAAAFRWDPALELSLSQRDNGAKFSGQIDHALTIYRAARDNAERRGTLDAARLAANGDAID